MGYEPGVPSHLAYDASSRSLFAADTANNAIKVLATNTGSTGSWIEPNYDGTVQRQVTGATLTSIVRGAAVGMSKPSGLELHNDMVFVSDNDTGRIFAFTKTGELIDWVELDVPRGALMGMAFDGAGALYVVDAVNEQILKITPQ